MTQSFKLALLPSGDPGFWRNTLVRRLASDQSLLFPGWYVEQQPKGVEVWVLNEKALVGFIENEPPTLTAQQQRLMEERLARYVRDHH